ncbi:hypothetical protein B9Z55_017414 [Caenorhabditis nigoni]|uniref:F-box domain-containing protein n=1 Tax=Caenorhabditis nigoni TaxID=1611254 RepID=A0A2G5T9W2_9PELO|nr:hypothetical protein B9Z55_017414 [Caenorhabditis nigoni]
MDLLPNRVLLTIFENCDFKDVLELRKVCRRFRNFIDDPENLKFSPDAKFCGIDLTVNENQKIDLSFHSEEDGSILMKNDSLDSAMRDLEKVLRFQQSKLTYFTLNINFPQKSFTLVFSGSTNIKTESVRFLGCNQNQIMSFLSHLDPNYLRKVYTSSDFKLEMSKIVETIQWKSADELYWRPQEISVSLDHLGHFSRLKVCFKTLSATDLDFLKNIYTKSSKFLEFDAYSKEFSDFEHLETLWGPPKIQSDGNCWFFKCSNRKNVLRIQCNFCELNFIKFFVFEKSDIPTGTVLLL